MAAGAPHKQGLDFFAFDVNTFDEPEILKLLEKEEDGISAFVFFMRLKCYIFSKTFYLKFDEDEMDRFRRLYDYDKGDKDKNAIVKHYLSICLNCDLFNKDLYAKYGILTSRDMQAKYMSSTKSRTKVIFIQEYLLINFDEYKFFDQVIYLETLNGELIERFYKKEYHKMDPVTKSPIVDPNQVVIPIRKSKDKPKKKAEPVEPVAEDPLPVVDKNEFTIRDVMDIVRVPYDNQTEEFKAYYFPPEFEDYVTLNKIIDERFPRIRSSRYQLTMAQFVELMSDYAPTQKELQDTFIKISGLGIKQDMSIGDRMIDCLTNWIRKPSAAPDQRDEHAPVAGENGIDGNYVRDEKFEKRVLDLWGMGESKYHQSHALVKGFCLSLYNQNQLDHFKHQFGFYEQVHLINGKYNFGFEKFLGNQKVLFSDGKWCSANWEQTYKDKTATNGSAKNGNTNTEHKSGVEHSETSHISFMSKIKGGN